MALTFHHLGVRTFFREVDYLENVPVIAGFDSRGPLYLPEMIDTKIVGNAHRPGKEFSFFCVTASANSVDNFDKNVLEDILGKIFVLYEEEDGSVQLIFVTDDQSFQSIQIAITELMDKFVVSFFCVAMS